MQDYIYTIPVVETLHLLAFKIYTYYFHWCPGAANISLMWNHVFRKRCCPLRRATPLMSTLFRVSR